MLKICFFQMPFNLQANVLRDLRDHLDHRCEACDLHLASDMKAAIANPYEFRLSLMLRVKLRYLLLHFETFSQAPEYLARNPGRALFFLCLPSAC